MRRGKRKKVYTAIIDLGTHAEVNLAPEQLAAYWNVDPQTIRKWVREGLLRGFRVGRAMRVRRDVALVFEAAQQLEKAG